MTDLSGNFANQATADEQDTKNVTVKKVGLFGYDASADDYIRLATSSDGGLLTASQLGSLIERYDYNDSTTIYTGIANKGTAASASSGWTITKYDLSDPDDASGLIATDVSWTNRVSGTYS